MHMIEKKMIELGAVDNTIKSIIIDDWFENAIISFAGNGEIGTVVCEFENCFEISLRHDKTYSKGKKTDGELDYKYFIQDVQVQESEGFLVFNISAWPLDGRIICKNIIISLAE